MDRFHFNVVDGGEHPDPGGTELDGVEAARNQALLAAGEMLRDAGKHGGPFSKDWTMTVTDSHGLVLFTLTFNLWESAAVKGS